MIFTPTNELMQSIPKLELADDASESSTFYVGFSTPLKTRQVSRSLVKKSVAIDESKNTCIETYYPKEDLENRWYTVYDINSFRTLNGFSLKKMQRATLLGENAVSVTAVLEHTYDACKGMLYEDIEVLCPIETAQLRGALRDPVYQVGLACYATSDIRRDVRERRRKVVEVVKLIQRATRNTTPEVTADYIRASVETISRPSRIFSQLIAEESL